MPTSDVPRPDDPVEAATGIPATWFERFRRELSSSQDAGRLQVVVAVKAAAHLAETVQAGWLAAHGLSLAQFNVLLTLWRTESGSRPMSHISRYLVCSPAQTTKVVDQLVRAGLVRRASDPNDRRSVLAQLTKEGEQRLLAVAPSQSSRVEVALGGLSIPACETLIGLLAEFRTGFERSSMIGAPGPPEASGPAATNPPKVKPRRKK